MTKKKTKALVLIVEGPTDEALFSTLLKDFFNPKGIIVFPFRNDIFVSQRGEGNDVRNKDIRNKIRNFVERELERQQVSAAKVLGIIHIGDMDGTFIPDDSIIISSQASEHNPTLYSDEYILVVNEKQRENIRVRNQQKSVNHRKMINIHKITIGRIEIPYVHFFMSCDTDHLIFNFRNLTKKEKEDLMDDFTDKNDSEIIRKILNSHMVNIPKDTDAYRYTWDKIQEGTNSLNRKTNTPLLFAFIESLIFPTNQDVDSTSHKV